MFIRKQRSGYYTNSGQHSGMGDYLALFSWNDYKAMDEIRAQCIECQCASKAHAFWMKHMHSYAYAVFGPGQDLINDWRAFISDRFNAYTSCEKHRGIRPDVCIIGDKAYMGAPKYKNGKPMLWALVRKCALSQCGQFMMGRIRIGGKSITVSGPCGSDGLPLDYQEVPASFRENLVLVPEDIAAAYWSNGGHNDIEYPAAKLLREWALDAFTLRAHAH